MMVTHDSILPVTPILPLSSHSHFKSIQGICIYSYLSVNSPQEMYGFADISGQVSGNPYVF